MFAILYRARVESSCLSCKASGKLIHVSTNSRQRACVQSTGFGGLKSVPAIHQGLLAKLYRMWPVQNPFLAHPVIQQQTAYAGDEGQYKHTIKVLKNLS